MVISVHVYSAPKSLCGEAWSGCTWVFCLLCTLLGSSFIPFSLSNSKRDNKLQKSFNRLHDVFQIIALISYSKQTTVLNGCKASGPELYKKKKKKKVEQTERESSKKHSFMISTLVSALASLGEGL